MQYFMLHQNNSAHQRRNQECWKKKLSSHHQGISSHDICLILSKLSMHSTRRITEFIAGLQSYLVPTFHHQQWTDSYEFPWSSDRLVSSLWISISDETPYRSHKISKLRDWVLIIIFMFSHWNLAAGSAAVLPRRLPNFRSTVKL